MWMDIAGAAGGAMALAGFLIGAGVISAPSGVGVFLVVAGVALGLIAGLINYLYDADKPAYLRVNMKELVKSFIDNFNGVGSPVCILLGQGTAYERLRQTDQHMLQQFDDCDFWPIAVKDSTSNDPNNLDVLGALVALLGKRQTVSIAIHQSEANVQTYCDKLGLDIDASSPPANSKSVVTCIDVKGFF